MIKLIDDFSPEHVLATLLAVLLGTATHVNLQMSAVLGASLGTRRELLDVTVTLKFGIFQE